MDWGLFRNFDSSSKNYLLRDKIMYPRWFYFTAICTNFVLRYLFLVPILFKDPTQVFWSLDEKLEFWMTISTFGEALRRAQWALIRIENEN